MPVLMTLIVIGVFIIYILSCFLFKPLGKLVYRIMEDFKKSISDEREEEKK